MILGTMQVRLTRRRKGRIGMLRKINVKDEVEAVPGFCVYRKIGILNRHVLRVVQVRDRTLDFHVHEASDEMFYVIEGSFQLETGEGLLRVDAGEFVIVPKGMRHRPVVTSPAKFLMVELEGTLNKENSGACCED